MVPIHHKTNPQLHTTGNSFKDIDSPNPLLLDCRRKTHTYAIGIYLKVRLYIEIRLVWNSNDHILCFASVGWRFVLLVLYSFYGKSRAERTHVCETEICMINNWTLFKSCSSCRYYFTFSSTNYQWKCGIPNIVSINVIPHLYYSHSQLSYSVTVIFVSEALYSN